VLSTLFEKKLVSDESLQWNQAGEFQSELKQWKEREVGECSMEGSQEAVESQLVDFLLKRLKNRS
jgi:hypothetical protein